ncbi:MAG: CHAT domain-containing protein [Gemmobacter sp.]
MVLRLFCLLLALALPAGLRAQEERDRIDQTFRAAQAAMTSAAGEALAQIAERAGAADPDLAAALRARQAAQNRLAEVQAALTDPAADRIRLTGEAEALAAEIARLANRIAARTPPAAATAPLDIASVQALLAPDEALVLIFAGQRQTFVWAVSPHRVGLSAVTIDPGTMSDAVSRLRATLDPTGAPARAAVALDPVAPAGNAFPRGIAWLLYRYLLEPLDPVLAQAAHVYLVPDGALTALPFGLLLTDPPEGDDADPAALRASPWLIRRHALTVLPSVESLRALRGLPAPAPDRLAFAGYGDPAFDGAMQVAALTRGVAEGGAPLMRGGLADPARLRALAPLPQTRSELRAIAQSLGAAPRDVILGTDATETAVKSADLSNRRIVVFATHGLLSGEMPGLDEPALVLTPPDTPTPLDDGLLTASEIAELRLDADWVILSACNTAGANGPGAEGLSGLARAFLFAGARAVLVSHWPVRDDAAARLTSGAFAALDAGQATGKADALRRAMIAVMQDTRDPTLAHPSAWAPFVLVGDGR